jgi:hypothetical protein
MSKLVSQFYPGTVLEGTVVPEFEALRVAMLSKPFRDDFLALLGIDSLLNGLAQRNYRSFNHPDNLPSLQFAKVHFANFERRFDEIVVLTNSCLLPTHTESRLARSMESHVVQELLLNNSIDRTQRWREPFACIEVKVRCLWLATCPGAGLIRFKCPDFISSKELLREFCKCMGLIEARASLVSIDMVPAVHYAMARRQRGDVALSMVQHEMHHFQHKRQHHDHQHKYKQQRWEEHNLPGITFLDTGESLSDNGVMDDDLLDILYRPTKEEILSPLRGDQASAHSGHGHHNLEETSTFGLKTFRSASL